jgi:hypothetical protein
MKILLGSDLNGGQSKNESKNTFADNADDVGVAQILACWLHREQGDARIQAGFSNSRATDCPHLRQHRSAGRAADL